MRTEKSPLRIDCSAWSSSCEGSGLPLLNGLTLERRRAEGEAGPRSVMEFPLNEYAIESEQEPAILDHKIVQTLLNQAEYQAFTVALITEIWANGNNPRNG